MAGRRCSGSRQWKGECRVEGGEVFGRGWVHAAVRIGGEGGGAVLYTQPGPAHSLITQGTSTLGCAPRPLHS